MISGFVAVRVLYFGFVLVEAHLGGLVLGSSLRDARVARVVDGRVRAPLGPPILPVPGRSRPESRLGFHQIDRTLTHARRPDYSVLRLRILWTLSLKRVFELLELSGASFNKESS